jgi:YD repeat-containing protein
VYGYDGNHNAISRKPPLGGMWTYDYANNRLSAEKDPAGNKVKIYTYNAAGQITKIETELSPGVRSTLEQSWYYTTDPQYQGQPYYTHD